MLGFHDLRTQKATGSYGEVVRKMILVQGFMGKRCCFGSLVSVETPRCCVLRAPHGKQQNTRENNRLRMSHIQRKNTRKGGAPDVQKKICPDEHA